MFVQAPWPVLGQHGDIINVTVDTVAERKIDETELPTKWNSRLRPNFGEDAETIKLISRTLEVSVEDVQRVLSEDYDADPREYAENAADEDAIYYGGA